MIEVKNINKSFKGEQVLFDISSKFEKGKVNLIIGQSGQGKSVLAKCIVGLHEIDGGQILFDGNDFTSMNGDDKTAIKNPKTIVFVKA